MVKKRGNQTINYDNGDTYDGEINEREQPHGKGKYTHHNESGQVQQGYYEGEWKNNEKHGEGIHRYRNGDIYEGSWRNGMRYGRGKYTYHNTTSYSYEGDWKNNKKDGKGKMKFSNGDEYDGDWKDNNMESDNAIYIHKGHSKYIGKCTVYNDLVVYK